MGKKLLSVFFILFAFFLNTSLGYGQDCTGTASVVITSDDTDNTICAGESVTFTAAAQHAGTTPKFQWRINGVNQGSNGSNTSFTSPSNFQNGSVVTVVMTPDCENPSPVTSNSIPTTVNPNPTVSAGGAISLFCQGGTTPALGGSFGGGATSAVWSDNGAGGTFTNNSGSNPNSTTYKASATATGSITLTLTTIGGSCGTTSASKTLTVSPNPTVNAGEPLPAICQGKTTASLGGSVGGGATSAVWSDGGAGGSFTNNTGNNPSSTTYTASASSTTPITLTLTSVGGSCGSVSASKTLTVNQNPTISAGGAISAICQGGTTGALGGSYGGGATSATWSDGGAGGTFTNNSGNPANTTYTASASAPASITLTLTTTGGSCGAVSATKTLTVNPNPTVSAGTALSAICQGGTTAALGGSFGAGATGAIWSDGTAGGTFTNNSGSNPGSTIYKASPTTTGTITLTLTSIGGSCEAVTGSKNLTINPTPTITGTTAGNRCDAGTVTLRATASTGTINWYDSQTGGNLLGSGTSYTISNLTASKTYYIDATLNGCTTASRTPVEATMTPTPSITSTTPKSFCSSGTVTLSATASAGTVTWYSTNSSTTPLGTGNNFTTPNISATTTYYVAAVLNGCSSARTAVTATRYTAAPTTGSGNSGGARITSNISGSICPGPSATGFIFNAPADSQRVERFEWNLPSGFTITAGEGTSSITVSVLGPGAVIANNQVINVKAINPCGSVTSNNYTVNVNSFADVDAGPDLSICYGMEQPLTNTLAGNANSVISWEIISRPSGTSGTGEIIGGPWNNDTKLPFIFTPTSVGNYTLKVTTNTASGNCPAASRTGTDEVTITVNALPAITSQPSTAAQILCLNAAATPLSVSATGAGLTYQWYSNTTNSNTEGTLLAGGTSSSYTPVTTTPGTLYYYVVVSGTCTPAIKSNVSGAVTVNASPAITAQPSATPQTLCLNAAPTQLSVTATGAGLTYQWYSNTTNSNSGGTLITNATSSTYTPLTSTAGTLYYYAIVSGTCTPAVTSSVSGAVTVNAPPVITVQPSTTEQKLCMGTAATQLSVTATGAGLTYQWYSNTTNSNTGGTLITNATSSTYTPVTSTAGTSYYYVIVGGTCTPAITSSVSGPIIINALPGITTHPSTTAESLCIDGTATELSVTATGTALTYQWYSNTTNSNSGGILLSGANSPTYTPVTTTTGTLYFYVVVGGTCTPAAISNVSGAVTVNEPVEITKDLDNSETYSVCAGFPIEFSIEATGSGLTYEWTRDGQPVGTNSPTLNISQAAASDTGNYKVLVKGTAPCSDFTSQEITLTVNQSLTVTTQPEPTVPVCLGEDSISLSVVVSGNIYDYIWRKNGIPISDGDGTKYSGATTANLTIKNLALADSDNYDVIISSPEGSCSQIISTPSAVTVYDPPTVDAGPDLQVCSTETSIALSGATAENHTNLVWTTSGGGQIANSDNLSTATYSPVAADFGTEVIFTLTSKIIVGDGQICEDAVDTRKVAIVPQPVLTEFSYSSSEFCETDTTIKTPTLTGENTYQGGKFIVEPSEGLSIDAAGKIDPSGSIPGSYSIIYSTQEGALCAQVDSDPVIIVIGEEPIATFSYDQEIYCKDTRDNVLNVNPTVVLGEGASAGVFTYEGSGILALNSTTGAVDLSSSDPGNYTITNTYDLSGDTEDGCIAVTAESTITITDKPIAVFIYPAAEYCSDPAARVAIEPIMGVNAVKGIWSYTATPQGASLALDPTTGGIDITTSAAGTFIITNSVDREGDGCDAVNDLFTITINKKSNATFAYTGQSFCITTQFAAVAEGYEIGGAFSSPTLGSRLNATTGAITWASTENVAGEHVVTYKINGKGVCTPVEYSTIIKIDPVPKGGILSFGSFGRVFLICEGTQDFTVPLTLSGSAGKILAWRYMKEGEGWEEIKDSAGNLFTGPSLPPELIGAINIDKTTVFRVEMESGACNLKVFSQTAIINIIPSNIKPTPVTVNPEVICIGEEVTLTSETGYATGTAVSGGEFDSANSLTSVHGWRVRRDGSTTNLDFPASGNNIRPNIWSNTNDHPFYTANINGTGGSEQRWDSGDKKFAIVTGKNPSTLETNIFNIDGMDEAIMTFDQAYNLTAGASIRVEISTNGGNSYEPEALYEVKGPASSGNYNGFGLSTSLNNKIQIDLGNYMGKGNLRIRFHFLGAKDGDIWALDAINVPNGPRNVSMEWNDYSDPNDTIYIGNSTSEVWVPKQIGWNKFVVKTMLIYNSNGDACDVAVNEESVEVFVYDSYISTPTAAPIACGINNVNLTATVTGGKQGLITNYPTPDGFVGHWEVTEFPAGYVFDAAHLSGGISNPSAVFTPNVLGTYSLEWVLELEDETAVSECETTINEVTFTIYDQYTSTATALVEACGDNTVELTGLLSGVLQPNITTLPTLDGTYGEWQVIAGPEGYTYSADQFSDVNDPAAIFTPTLVGTYSLRWAIINENNTICEHSVTDVEVTVYDQYSSTAEAVLDTCETNSFNLTATVSGTIQGIITLPSLDGTTGKWEVTDFPVGYEFSESHFSGGTTDPNSVFTPLVLGEYTLQWTLSNESLSEECLVPATLNFKLFDQYTLTAEAQAGSCGVFDVQLTGTTTGIWQETVTYPTLDGYIGQWSVTGGDGTFSNPDPEDIVQPINNPNAIFTANALGSYTFTWELIPDPNYVGEFVLNTSCPATPAVITIEIKECIALDFDGVNDYVDLGEGYTGNYSLEAWILPKDPGGTIVSGPNFNITTPAGVSTTKWTHVAVSNGSLYLDGVLQTGISVNGNGGIKTLIGARWTEDGPTDFFHGWIEEVRIWNGPISQENIRFTMNQRLKPTGNIGVEVDMDHPDSPAYSDLAGYYQLLATEADILPGGLTLNLATNGVNGKLMNMETLQENTAPLPYFTKQDGSWDTAETWARPTVWKIPNTNGVNWNIVRTLHNVNATRDISVLGLISVANTLDMVGTIPADGSHIGIGTGNALTVSHYLKLDGIIDLNGESQLIQPELSILVPESTGHLDRDQQGKRNSFVYNYWASPVSTKGSENNGGYTVGGVLLDGTNPVAPASINFQDYHGAADGVRSTPITLSTYWLWAFTPAAANVYAEWDHIRATGSVRSGEGFTMKGTDGNASLSDGQNYTFRGKPHNGNITLSMGPNQNYLIGNPYPSAIDADQLIRDYGTAANPVFDGSLYFWDHFVVVDHILKEYIGGYAVYNLIGGISGATSSDDRINDNGTTNDKIPSQFIPVGQGFMVNSSSPVSDNGYGGNIIFKNSYREYKEEKEGSIFLNPEIITKGSIENPKSFSKIRFSFSSPVGYYRQILVGAVPHTTNGFDLGYDALLFDDHVEDMYFVQGENYLVIQGVPHFNADQILPLGVKIKENKPFTIRIDSLENAPAGMKVYLNDKLNDSIHDLTSSSYNSTSEPGVINDRFEIIFFKEEPPVIEVPGEEIPGEEIVNLTITHAHDLRQIKIINPEEMAITGVYLFDLKGNLIDSYGNLPNEKEFKLNVASYATGVYLVKVYTEGKIVSKKIIISN